MKFGHLNNFETQLGAALVSGATSMQIVSGATSMHGASTSMQYALTLSERDIRGRDIRREVVYVTARSDNNLTVIRGREGTGAQSWPVGTPVEARTTAGVLASFRAQDDITAAINAHEAVTDPHPQYQKVVAGVSYAQQVSITGAALNLTDGDSESVVTVPPDRRLYLDSIDLVVVSADTVSGAPEVQAGPDSANPATYLAATALTGAAEGDRDVLTPLISGGVTAVRFSVNTPGTATAWTVIPVIRGYLLEV